MFDYKQYISKNKLTQVSKLININEIKVNKPELNIDNVVESFNNDQTHIGFSYENFYRFEILLEKPNNNDSLSIMYRLTNIDEDYSFEAKVKKAILHYDNKSIELTPKQLSPLNKMLEDFIYSNKTINKITKEIKAEDKQE